MADASTDLLTSLLRDVSRSFYLTLRCLPRPVRGPIGLAYLLARTSDTIADTPLIPLADRLTTLKHLAERIAGNCGEPMRLAPMIAGQADSSEGELLKRCEEALSLLATQTREDRARIRQVLSVIISGQDLDLRRFGDASADSVVPLLSAGELDDYTYRVAGCVGEFWTRMCLAHLFSKTSMSEDRLLESGVRFGKGLQLVNILRDLPADLKQGRCYIPLPELEKAGLTPSDLLDGANESRFRPIYDAHLSLAESHLKAGWDYTNALPHSAMRVRLACAWPILIGLKTIRLLRTGSILDATRPIKVSRAQVRHIILGTIVRYPFSRSWERLVL